MVPLKDDDRLLVEVAEVLLVVRVVRVVRVVLLVVVVQRACLCTCLCVPV